MSNRLSDLNPDAQGAAVKALAALASASIPYVVTATLRTREEQVALYAQGRKPLAVVNAYRQNAGLPPLTPSENSYTVTQCDGIPKAEGGTGRSLHQLGNAIDIVPRESNKPVWPPESDPRWKQIADIVKQFGFEWGGDWDDFHDMPHYQYHS